MKTNLEQYGFKGTPSPWEAEEDEDQMGLPFYVAHTPLKGRILYVCALGDDCTDTTGEMEYYNAKLIAKAPELAMALIEIYKAMYRTELGRGLNELVDSVEPLLKSIGVEI